MLTRLNLEEEAILEKNIQFKQPLSKNIYSPKAVFLTGTTGFLGGYLLHELLHNTTANIYCLIRCKNPQKLVQQRLKEHLHFYSLWDEKYSSRIIPVLGDLSQPQFGLSDEAFNTLALTINIIYHNGAWVNAMYPYSLLKKTNVGGTFEVLRLASLGQTKPLHFISTIAVFFNQPSQPPSPIILETQSPKSNLKGGYKQSKWVAERLILEAQTRGLPTCIYRLGRVMGDRKTGITQNLNDLLISMIKVCVLLKKYPDWNSDLSLIPVDYGAESIIHLSLQKQSSGKIFHILNPNSIQWVTFFEAIKQLGYPLERVNHQQWKGAVQDYRHQNKDPKLAAILRFVLNASTAMKQNNLNFDTRQTLAGLKNTHINCPIVETQLISTWISYLQQCGKIPSITP
jgi:thioester reductase-like protein